MGYGYVWQRSQIIIADIVWRDYVASWAAGFGITFRFRCLGHCRLLIVSPGRSFFGDLFENVDQHFYRSFSFTLDVARRALQ